MHRNYVSRKAKIFYNLECWQYYIRLEMNDDLWLGPRYINHRLDLFCIQMIMICTFSFSILSIIWPQQCFFCGSFTFGLSTWIFYHILLSRLGLHFSLLLYLASSEWAKALFFFETNKAQFWTIQNSRLTASVSQRVSTNFRRECRCSMVCTL
jgi:hypothetical protein